MDEEDIPSIEELILNGIVEVAAIDPDTGEFLYNFTKDFKEAMPEIYEIHMQYVYGEVLYFWERGFVLLEDFESENPIIRLTTKALDEDALASLPKDKRQSLEELKRILKVL